MPLVRGHDAKGTYYRWGPAGSGGAKYHYTAGNKTSRERAKSKAMSQARAIEASKARRRVTGGAAARRRASPKKPSLSSASRSQRKVADKSRVGRVAGYRRSKPPPRTASKRR